jgi:peptide/nickel transport system substrate-binding protein
MTFTDGEAVTAEDFKFTVDYIKEQEPGGSITATTYENVEEVQVDSPDGTTVNVFLSQKDNRWLSDILGSIILPQHVWSNVPDFSKYTPRNSEEGLVGHGLCELSDYNWENWFELSVRDDSWLADLSSEYDWLSGEAPFLESVRFEVFGSGTAMEQKLLDGDIDMIYQGTSVDKALDAREEDYLEVKQSPSSGYNHISHNVRRVPFDDRAFRQFLHKAFDSQWVVQSHYKNVGAEPGDYVVKKIFENWRPPAPDEAEAHEGIPLPDLDFPNPGTFDLNQEQINSVRSFLVDHDDAKHDYSFGDAQTSITSAPDGKELYVNGSPLTEAHTNNAGEGGEGPLTFDYQPPQEDLAQAKYGQRYVGLLNKIGVPTEGLVRSINSQLGPIYVQEDFDFYAMGWGLGVNMTHLAPLYASQGADLEGDQDVQKFNSMGYTGADDPILEQQEMMRNEDRWPVVKRVCAQIWNDAPTIITEEKNLIEPVNTRFEGYINTFGGTMSTDTSLNLRLSGDGDGS